MSEAETIGGFCTHTPSGQSEPAVQCRSEDSDSIVSSLSQQPSSIRGILKQHRLPSANDRATANSLSLLCPSPSPDELFASVQLVFKNLCSNELFDGGCSDSFCSYDHRGLPNLAQYHQPIVWDVARHLICHSPRPDVRILNRLVRFYSSKRQVDETLAFAICISKIKNTEKIKFAEFLVEALSEHVGREDAVTRTLFLSFPTLEEVFFNLLMGSLGVFDRDPILYAELLSFLNYRAYSVPSEFLSKLMDGVVKGRQVKGLNSGIVQSLVRLSSTEFEQIKPVVAEYLQKTGRSLGSIISERLAQGVRAEPVKTVRWCDEANAVELEELPSVEVAMQNGSTGTDFGDSDCSTSGNVAVSCVVDVFGEVCFDWILKGTCNQTLCSRAHRFDKVSLIGRTVEEVALATDFFLEEAACPRLETLKTLINFIQKPQRDLCTKLLPFGRCSSRLSFSDRSALTRTILAQLCQQYSRWEAIEMVLLPDLLRPTDGNDSEQFHFDRHLLSSLMNEAVDNGPHISRCLVDEVLRRVLLLPPTDSVLALESTTDFLCKFVLKNTSTAYFYPDLVPPITVDPSKLSSRLINELQSGYTNQYFLACAFLKFAVARNFHKIASESLYKFLISSTTRAHILDELLRNCLYFRKESKTAVVRLLESVGTCVVRELHSNGDVPGTADVLRVLSKHKLSPVRFEPSSDKLSSVRLKLIWCSAAIESGRYSEAIDVFLKHCFQPYVDSDSSNSIEMKVVAEKMFVTFINSSLAEECLQLFVGIFACQKALILPLNIMKFYESTLRCSFSRPCNPRVRAACLQMYFDVESTGVHTNLHKATCRSVLLFALKEVTSLGSFTNNQPPIVLHPLIKKLLVKCIRVDAYPSFNTRCDRMSLYSSMTEDEIRIYLLWWLSSFMCSRKNGRVDYYCSLVVRIGQDVLQDSLGLPIFHKLTNVDASVSACVERVNSAVKSLLTLPLSPLMMRTAEKGTYELSPSVVRALAQVVVPYINQRNSIGSPQQRQCTFCFDDSVIAGNLSV